MKRFLPILAASVLSVASTSAAILVQTNNFNINHDGINSTFNQFDSTLGTLTGVELTVTSLAAGSFSIVNSSPSSTIDVSNILDYIYISSSQLDELNSGSNLPTINLTTSITSGQNPVSKKVGGVIGSSTFSIVNSPNQYLANNFSFNIFTLAPYIGLSTVSFSLQDTTSATLVGGTPNANFADISDPTSLTLTYSYSAVPEPSTYLLFGLGALALVIVARRRKNA